MSGWADFGKGAMNYAPAIIDAIGAREAGRSQAAVYGAEARIARQQASADEESQRRKARQFMGDQAASIAQAGIGSGGTAAKVMEQSALMAELDALNIRYGGQLKAAGLMSQARAAKTQGNILAGTKLLTGITRAYMSANKGP